MLTLHFAPNSRAVRVVWLFAELRETIPEGIFKIAKPYVFMTAKEVHVNNPMYFVVT